MTEKIINGELRADVQYKGKPLTYEDASDVIHKITIVLGGGGCISENMMVSIHVILRKNSTEMDIFNMWVINHCINVPDFIVGSHGEGKG